MKMWQLGVGMAWWGLASLLLSAVMNSTSRIDGFQEHIKSGQSQLPCMETSQLIFPHRNRNRLHLAAWWDRKSKLVQVSRPPHQNMWIYRLISLRIPSYLKNNDHPSGPPVMEVRISRGEADGDAVPQGLWLPTFGTWNKPCWSCR